MSFGPSFKDAERELERVESIESTRLGRALAIAHGISIGKGPHGSADATPTEVLIAMALLDLHASTLPRGSWSSSPPAKPGDYFACDTGAGAKPFVTTVIRTFDPAFRGALVFIDQRGMKVPVTSLGYVWWSEAIVAPPRT